jgi:hypothetical protein
MSIDGEEDRWPVYLPAGISAAEQRTRIARALPEQLHPLAQ